jgi:hypothetical protein
MQVETSSSAIRHLYAVSNDSSARDVARLALRQLQDAAVNRLYRRQPPTHSRLLNLGCGDCLYPGWVNADRFRTGYWIVKLGGVLRGEYRLPDWFLDAGAPWRCADDHWDGIYTEHMLEHLSYREAVVALGEMLRTLGPGRWARIIVPDLQLYVDFCNGLRPNCEFRTRFAHGAEAISFLTQNFGHVSTWDGALLTAVLTEIGFVNVRVVAYGVGSDPALLRDSQGRRWESVYVEAQKAARGAEPRREGQPLEACLS